MSRHMPLEFAAKTDIGMVRVQNEDTVVFDAGLQLAILADGMGGYNAGEVASSIATVAIQEEIESQLQEHRRLQKPEEELPTRLWLMQAVRQANSTIINAARREPEYRGMGTTLVVAWFEPEGQVSIAHVGDSRAYRVRDGLLEQLTRDHSLLQEQIDAGLIRPEDAQFALNRNIVTRAVGIDYQLVVEVHQHALQAGDLYLLCSDGLSDRIGDGDISNIISDAQGDLTMACTMLINAANQCGGQDNVSVILVRVAQNE
ncbi:Stp1/IreP family PP2C-type Ser/Thr phosphatase [Collimonas pratensis]|nr:Stp1/IreP family PP2C-type Ser/Thr phosphatase [Collimonas pratensis]NKI71937.1 Stp1/IreP family PP2C-type Ser/Thr phosphatase [Collimonas pratensis]